MHMAVTARLAAPGQAPERFAPPPRKRVIARASFGHLVMVAAALLAFVLVMAVLRNRDATVTVAVAAHDIQPGARVEASDVRLVELPADSPLLASLVPAAQLEGSSAEAVRRLPKGSVIARTDIATGGNRLSTNAMSIPLGAEHAVGGQLSAGDHVDVIDGGVTPAAYVLRNAEVLAVASTSRARGLAQVRSEYFVTVAVDPDSALRLAEAIAAGKLELVRSTGEAPE